MNSLKTLLNCFLFTVIGLGLLSGEAAAREINISGVVSDAQFNAVPGATVTLSLNSITFKAVTSDDGSYKIRIDGVYPAEPQLIETGIAFPAPFSEQVNIPLITGGAGDIQFAVYDLSGRKLTGKFFPAAPAGSYRITWDGRNGSGQPVPRGIYVYAITLRGRTISGRLIKAGDIHGSGGITLLPFMFPDSGTGDPGTAPEGVFNVTAVSPGYHTTSFSEVHISRDTVINLILKQRYTLPFKATTDHIAVNETGTYLSLILKGVNLGTAPPGFFPGEIAYAITPQMYESWIEMMAETGFNSVRVYTLHPPVFYQKLAEYNLKNPTNPLYLFQGVWLDEPEDPSDLTENNLTNRTASFVESIREVIDCMHGNKTIAFRPGRAYGEYTTDISPWIAGLILGREISPFEVQTTNGASPGLSSWSGNHLSITSASASELFAARMLDETITYEQTTYSVRRPVSMSSWPTLDPLTHPTEIYTDEDVAHIDIKKITQISADKLLFASYHAYPYYPDFVSNEPEYRAYSDNEGPNNYLGYLTALRNYYEGIPLIIGEFGVPSSWGNAHNSFSGMHHGGLSEIQQGNYNLRMMRNIINAGCGGGFMFAWMDEWFKQTWIVNYMEAFGISINGTIVPTRQLWHNLVSPEQNFGLITFDPLNEPSWSDYSLSSSTEISSLKASHDNSYFFVDITTAQPPEAGDTFLIAFDTYLADTGEGLFPGGLSIPNRAEFMLEAVLGSDSVSLFVTEAYNMFGLTPRFNLADHTVQKFKTTNTTGAPWKLMQWINNGFDTTIVDIGRLPAENSETFTPGERTSLIWSGANRFRIRLPWTLLHFYDPTQSRVIDGAESFDGGYNFLIYSSYSNGVAISVLNNGLVTHTLNRYSWPSWLTVPQTSGRPKKTLEIVREGLRFIPGFAN